MLGWNCNKKQDSGTQEKKDTQVQWVAKEHLWVNIYEGGYSVLPIAFHKSTGEAFGFDPNSNFWTPWERVLFDSLTNQMKRLLVERFFIETRPRIKKTLVLFTVSIYSDTTIRILPYNSDGGTYGDSIGIYCAQAIRTWWERPSGARKIGLPPPPPQRN